MARDGGPGTTHRNGFDGMWNPICPGCGGYLYAGCTCSKPHVDRLIKTMAAAVKKGKHERN